MVRGILVLRSFSIKTTSEKKREQNGSFVEAYGSALQRRTWQSLS